MNGFLLDVNVLIALAWPSHVAHERVKLWFVAHARQGWATCPLTECAFVRIISNPAFSPHALTLQDAVRLLTLNTQHPAHRFWADDIALGDAVQGFQNRLVGHQQVSDAYLLGLALHRKGKLATLDTRVVALLPERSPLSRSVEVLPQA